MCKTSLRLRCMLMLVVVGLLWAAPVLAQTPEEPVLTDTPPPLVEDVEDPDLAEPDAETVDATNPPPFILALVEAMELKQEQVDQMRTDGAGWGNIRIAALLAEQISAGSEGTVSFDDALASVLAARAEGKGFGEIAGENNLKVGPAVRNSNQRALKALDEESGVAGDGAPGAELGETTRVRERKGNAFGRLVRFLGFGKPEKPEKPEKMERPARAEKVERPERPDRPEKPEKPEKPERPERPEKPEKPEKPERGPRW